MGRVVVEGAFGIKWGDHGDSLDGVASRWIVGASASFIFPCTIKSRWQAVMEEVGKGCSEFCITVGTVTSSALPAY